VVLKDNRGIFDKIRIIMKAYILLIMLFLSLNVKSQTGFCFNMPSTVVSPTVSMGPSSHTNADFNNDGHADIAAINSFSSSISVLFGVGDGHFNSISSYSLSGNPTYIISADFNQDNYLDLAVAHQPNTVSILLGTNTGSFALPAVYYAAHPQSITTGDFNGDGNLDIVSCGGTNKINFLFGSSTGTFVSTPDYTLSNATGPNSIAAVDIDNDGSLDVITANYSSSNISLLKGNGSGTIVSQTQYNVGASPVSLLIDDFNNDSYMDIITSGNTGSILLNNLVGSFSVQSLTTSINTSVASADLNNDGNKDLITAKGNIVGIALGNGLGSFAASRFYSSGVSQKSISISDFNEDGNLDISVGTIYGNHLSIHFGAGNGDLIGAENYMSTGALAMCAGDFNLDGKDDLALCQEYNNNNLVTYFGTDSGTLSSQVIYPNSPMTTLYEPNEIIYEDFNNDGSSDLIVSNKDGGMYPFISVFIGSGTGSFTFNSVDTLTQNEYLHSMTVSDFNIDGSKDLAISTNSNTIYLLLGTGSGTFNHTVINLTTSNTQQLRSSDFNGDNKPDLAVISGGQFLIFIGTGNGLFLSPVSYSVGLNPYTFAIADYNLDGNIDIVVNSTGTTTTLLGTGNGTFNSSGNTLQGVQTGGGLKAGDFNSDGKPDLVMSDVNGLLLFEGDGTGLFYNSVSYPVGQAIKEIITIDINGDQRLDLVASFSNSIYIALLINGPVITTNVSNSICSGSTFTLNAFGASTYTWSTGAIGNSTLISPTVSTTYTVIGSNSGGCLTTATFSVNVLALPSLSVALMSSSVCISTSALVSASGANSYLWSTGATTSTINVMPTASTIYSVTGTGINGCVNTEAVSITVDPTCQDVWPGDANSDGVADNLDVLELGLHYTQTGSPRITISNTWQPYFSNNWAGTITNGKNLNHSDCNGDGTINDDDTLAIFNNYALTHAFKPVQTTTVNTQISIVPDQMAVVKGTWGSSSIYLGDALTSISNINGLAFTVNFDNTLIETNSVWIEYPASFLNASNQNLHFRKLDFATGNLYTATTHTINNDVNGNGLIAVLHYKINSGLTSDQVLSVGIVQAGKSNTTGDITPLTSGTATLLAMGVSVGLQELNENFISMSPNPTNGSLTINSKTALQKVEVISVTGQIVLSEIPTNVSHTLHLENFSNGIYFMNVYQNGRIVKREKIVLNK
jgi:hypothetical protein